MPYMGDTPLPEGYALYNQYAAIITKKLEVRQKLTHDTLTGS